MAFTVGIGVTFPWTLGKIPLTESCIVDTTYNLSSSFTLPQNIL